MRLDLWDVTSSAAVGGRSGVEGEDVSRPALKFPAAWPLFGGQVRRRLWFTCLGVPDPLDITLKLSAWLSKF